MSLDSGFQQEIDLTARLLSSSDVMLVSRVSLLPGTEDGYFRIFQSISENNSNYFKKNQKPLYLKPDNVTMVIFQFGHPNFQSNLANYSNFKPDITKKI
jgi:hypothetical protein